MDWKVLGYYEVANKFVDPFVRIVLPLDDVMILFWSSVVPPTPPIGMISWLASCLLMSYIMRVGDNEEACFKRLSSTALFSRVFRLES